MSSKHLELCWYPTDEGHLTSYGLVWSSTPIYCAASVAITKDFIIINQTGMHGLTKQEHASLLACLVKEHPTLEVL